MENLNNQQFNEGQEMVEVTCWEPIEDEVMVTTDFANTIHTLGDQIIFKQNLTGVILSLAGALLLNIPITSLIKNKVNIK